MSRDTGGDQRRRPSLSRPLAPPPGHRRPTRADRSRQPRPPVQARDRPVLLRTMPRQCDSPRLRPGRPVARHGPLRHQRFPFPGREGMPPHSPARRATYNRLPGAGPASPHRPGAESPARRRSAPDPVRISPDRNPRHCRTRCAPQRYRLRIGHRDRDFPRYTRWADRNQPPPKTTPPTQLILPCEATPSKSEVPARKGKRFSLAGG